MRSRFALAVGLAALCAVLAASTPAAAQKGGNLGNPGVAPPQSNPYGLSYAEWTTRWWTWAMAIPYDRNPLLDTSGASAAIGQSGPVWFIAGTSGLTTPVTRTITVPSGKALLFPLINYLNDYDPYNPGNPYGPGPLPDGVSLLDWLSPFANFIIDATTILEVEVDGVSIQNLRDYRTQSDVFWFRADPSLSGLQFDPVVNPDGLLQPGVSDGYWIMLRPLPVGKHTIHWHSYAEAFPGWPFQNEVTVNLTMVPGKK